MFTFDQEHGEYLAGVRSDGTYLGQQGLFPFQGAAVSVPAHAGDVIVLFGTGFGPTSPATPDVPATVQFAGLVTAREHQFNIVVPGVAAGDRPLVLTVNGVKTEPNAFLAAE